MKLLPIHTSDAYYADVEALLVEAFPPEERRPIEKQREYTDGNPLFHPYTVVDDGGTFIGIVTCWRLDDFLYIEHLATMSAVRGSGYGAKIIALLKMLYADKPIVLEVEPPVGGTSESNQSSPSIDITHRRIAFYRRSGFVLWKDKEYIQPPYSDELPSVPLLLMTCRSFDGKNSLDENLDFERIKTEIHREVYGV